MYSPFYWQAVLLSEAFFHHTLEKRFWYVTALFYFIEVSALFLLDYLYAHQGKQYLPYLIYAAAAIFFMAVVFDILRQRPSLPHG